MGLRGAFLFKPWGGRGGGSGKVSLCFVAKHKNNAEHIFSPAKK